MKPYGRVIRSNSVRFQSTYAPLSVYGVQLLKGHGNEADFLGFLQKLVPHESLTLPFEPFRFWLRISGDICILKTTPHFHRYGESPTPRISNMQSRQLSALLIHEGGDSPHHRYGEKRCEKNGYSRQSCRLPDSPMRGVDFWIWISPRIRSQNRNGLKGSVRDLGLSDLCKNIGKTGSLPCPFYESFV